ncbi:type VI secretion system Vgr family protein [Chryseobacterium sp. ERMR1:04]|uniref:type VI secretion system Vgr family protein n=1 Tax=Chryseobacterium sp. ERMR1:04 TaxID=1705393 RepID=UPI000F5037E0|nr:phage baseplate assembly protein V [Chryseobacterium sp. ERMR1:04]
MTNPESDFFESNRPKAPNNADSIAENSISGINRMVELEVYANGKPVKHFKHFKLTQSAVKHHEFEIILAHDSLENRQTHNLQDANKLLGKRFTATFKYKGVDKSPDRSFVGVITSVGFSQDKMSLGDIVLKGYSPTILLDGAPHTQSFGGNLPVNMGIIANEVIKQGLEGYNYDFSIDTNDSSQILYSSQYDETHYNYLARMAEAYGEQFFYDGYVLHFGKLPQSSPPIKLIYGSNVSDVKVELNVAHTKPQFYGYNSSKNEKLTSGETPVKHLGDLARTAYENNDSIYKTPALKLAPLKAATHLDVEYSQKSAAGSKGVDVFTTSGSTTKPFLYPGCVADISMREQDSNKTKHFTTLMITEATHEVDARGYYTGTFEGIAEGTGFMPTPDFVIPAAQPQIATVISNTDPSGQGRVSVRFDWQLNDTTDFIRVMSPDAGGTDQINQNRGYVAIPEVGDQVMVNFQHGHPDRPFVMGGMFHGGTGLGGGINNKVKSIQTRSGHKVVFTEDESIIISDKSGNEIYLDTVGKSMNITAPETITITAKNININASENMNTTVGMNKSDNIGMNHAESVGAMKTTSVIGDASMFITGKLTEMIEGEVHSETKQDRNEISHEDMELSSNKSINKNAQLEVKNNSGEKSKNH